MTDPSFDRGAGGTPRDAQWTLQASAFEASPLALLVVGAFERIHTANGAASRILGRLIPELEGARLVQFVEDSQRLELAALVESARSGDIPARREITFLLPDGTVRIGGVSLARMAAAEETHGEDAPLVVVVIRDVTDERSLRDGLIDAERFAKIRLAPEAVQRMHDLVLVHRHGRVIYVNDLTVRKLGHHRDTDLVGRLILDLVHAEDRSAIAERTGTLMREGRASAPRTSRLLRRDGSYIEAEFVGIPILFHGESAVLALGRDLSERTRLEAQLALNERLVATGTLAAGIAHEVNNPLSYVLTNLEVLDEELTALRAHASDERVRDLQTLVFECRDGLDRIRKIVNGMKGISRSDAERRALVELKAVLDRAISMTSNEIRHRARLVCEYGPTPLVDADEARLTQVFINVLLNASQAIPDEQREEGEIRVETSTDSHGRAQIEIRDTGCGIAPEHLHRVFDPFFTLKPVGVGTGLGLAISHGIIASLGGVMEVESTLGKGALFRVILPPAQSAVPEAVPAAEAAPAGRRGRVLLVDDEPKIGSALRRILGREHDVVTLEGGREALALIAGGARFDIILCDLMMPDGNGMELHASLSSVAPEQAERMVFATGGAFSDRSRAFLDKVPNERLEKPFDTSVLRATIRRFVRRNGPSSRPAASRSSQPAQPRDDATPT